MATFALNITTDDVLELQGIINKLAGELPTVRGVPFDPAALPSADHVAADQTPIAEPEAAPAGNTAPERDAHGIKRDARIHADAAEPFKADGTWKRRRNLADEEYDAVYAELVAEAQVGGVYTGPQVEPAPAPAPVAANDAAPAPAPVTDPAPAPQAAAPAPAPQAAAPAPTGMSAEQTPLAPQVIMALVQAAGPTAAATVLKAMGVSNVALAAPEQLRLMKQVADSVAELGIPAAEKAARGPQALADVLLTHGYVAEA